MSATSHDLAAQPGGHAGHGVRSEQDHVPAMRLFLVGAAALLVFFVGSLLTVGYLRARQAAGGPFVVPAEVGRSKIALVEQQPFDLATRGERARARQLERLGSAGWVDRSAGVAHIPIEEAMRLVAAGARPSGAEPDSPPVGGQP
jgi:hypothetical protein